MKIGMNMGLWSDNLADEKYQPLFARLKEIGFDGVELPLFTNTPDELTRLAGKLAGLGLEVTSSSALAGEENPLSDYKTRRDAAMNKMKKVLDCCNAGGIPLLIGPMYACLGEFTGTGRTDSEWNRAVNWVGEASEYARKSGVTLALEYLNRFEVYFLNSAGDMAEFVEEVNHPNCRMMYDTFHANIEEKNPATAIRNCAHLLEHVHISENDRSTPGKGQVDWKASFDTLKDTGYDKCLTIEAFGQKLPSLAAATKIWRPMFEDELELARDGYQFISENWISPVTSSE